MNKSVKYRTKGALLCGTGNALINALNQMNSTEEFDWSKFFKAFGKGALVGGVVGYTFGALRDNKMTKVLKKTAGVSGYLKCKLQACRDQSSKSTLEKANHVREQLHLKFGSQLAEYPTLHGSAVKGLSIEGSDVDVQVAFKHYTGSIANVYEMVNDFCAEEYEDKLLTSVRSQKHSVGLSFNIDNKDQRIDVVPLRQVNNGTGDSYLYVGNTSLFGTSTYKKTNPQKQLAAFKFTPRQKRIIKLLKSWKLENAISIKSMHLEYLVYRAFSKTKMPRDMDKCLLEVIKFIGKNITTMRFVDPGNSNNIISNTLTNIQKVNIQVYCFEMLDNIDKDERNIMDYFGAHDIQVI